MKEQTISKRGYNAVARVPESADIANLKVGDLAPDAFGRLSRVTRIAYRSTDIKGFPFVGYMTALSDADTAENGCGCSQSMKEGQLIRTTALTGALTSAECDELERAMQ